MKKVRVIALFGLIVVLAGCNATKTETLEVETSCESVSEFLSEVAPVEKEGIIEEKAETVSVPIIEKESEKESEEKSEKKYETKEETQKNQGIEINESNFPDATFRTYISKKFDNDKDEILSEEEADKITSIGYIPDALGGPPEIDLNTITTFKGIEYFTNLENLSCMNYTDTSIDVSKNTKLKNLELQSSSLTSIDISNNSALIYVGLNNSNITSLNTEANINLVQIDAIDSALSSISLSNKPNLQYLRLLNTNITSLNISGCPLILEQIGRARQDLIQNEVYNGYDYSTDTEGTFLSFDSDVELIIQ